MQQQIAKRVLGPIDTDYALIEQRLELTDRVIDRIQSFVETPNFSYAEGVGKVAHVMSLCIRTGLNLMVVAILLTLARVVWVVSGGGVSELGGSGVVRAFLWVLGSGVFQAYFFLVALVVTRRILLRLDRMDLRT
jgi:hypothetical protein